MTAVAAGPVIEIRVTAEGGADLVIATEADLVTVTEAEGTRVDETRGAEAETENDVATTAIAHARDVVKVPDSAAEVQTVVIHTGENMMTTDSLLTLFCHNFAT